ncbi:zinc-binding alcohol dehydrogenase family protein [Nocardioides sp. YIM 152315]|uniref:quinone oxidoreductase family protein n=1 Tax=Nocardioides sp. YIM 152315 TaxID=3031760 RepID=UPI0023DBE154|nr:zinc-binding alcohol dehydrogenase family protein [Nocardioides sp. YIM 152315]MDF1604524.1 zinc-binding alcohol dehydrogenase family protein [Nocardioides sp. YIM 152315]
MMRAARFHEWGGPPLVEDVPEPAAGAGETLVRITAAAVSHLDLTVASGDFGIRPELPHVGGVEGAGLVVASATHAAGTLVNVRGDGLGLHRGGSWAELVVVPDECATPVPPEMPAPIAATYRQPVTTAAVTLWDVAGLGRWHAAGVSAPDGETVLVTGAAGAVGAAAVQLALRAGCRVHGLVKDEHQAARLTEGGVPVLLEDRDRHEDLARERPFTLLVDTVGGPELADRSRWVAPGGRVAVVGYVAGTEVTLDLPGWLLDDVALLPVNMMRRQEASRRWGPELVALVASGELTVDVATFALEDAPAAVRRLRVGGACGRVVLLPGSAERTP